MIKPTKEFWTQAYQANIGRLTGICYRYTGNYQLSEDLAHDAFLKAIEKWRSFRGEGNFDAWLRRIVVNQVLQHLRDQKRHPYLQQLTPDQAAEIAAQDDPAPGQPMEFTIKELLESIAQLPDHHRLVFNLYVLDNFTHARIGDELGISEGTSKSHLARARKKLQHLLTGKINTRKEKDKEERAAILLLALTKDADTDHLFIKSFDRFFIPTSRPLSLHRSTLTRPLSTAAVSAGMVICLSVFFIVKMSPDHDGYKLGNSISIPVQTVSMSHEKEKAKVSQESATILENTVKPGRTKKLPSMKPLDSLALILALSTATVNVASPKDSIKIDFPPPTDRSQPTLFPKVEPGDKGTFRASELYWSKENNRVSFRGEVRVDFKEQHFQGNGTFDFLGTVPLLVVDGQVAVLGKTIKLLKQDYRLSIIGNEEAVIKYGDQGKNGAVVIEIIDTN